MMPLIAAFIGGFAGHILYFRKHYWEKQLDQFDKAKSERHFNGRNPTAQFTIECVGGLGLMGMSIWRLTEMSESSSTGAYGVIISSFVGVAIVLSARAYFLFFK